MRRGLALLLAVAAAPCVADNIAAELETPSVEVVGTTLLPGVGTPLAQVPGNVQLVTGDALARRGSSQLAEHLQRLAAGAHVNEAQGNPYQPDFSFRGFVASPLLGTGQGLSVFQDGVRINESFGDVVNWDLLPPAAISSAQLLPGSNPVFGLNTLGGALSIQTRSGLQHPGGAGQIAVGSYGRRQLAIEAGGAREQRDWFVAADRVEDPGWREHSPTRLARLFAKFGVQSERDDFDFSLTAADNRLDGIQALPRSLLDRPRQAYTWPDTTYNRLLFAHAKASRVVGDEHVLVANLFYRQLEVRALASNVNDSCGPSCASLDGLRVDQGRLGGGLQYTYLGRLAGRGNRLSLGFTTESGRAAFIGEEQTAAFTADRGAVAIAPPVATAQVGLRHGYAHFYVTDTLSLTEALHLTASLSYSRAAIGIRDRSGAAPALDGDHRFGRWNPALGFAWSPTPRQTWFADWSQGMRAPTPVELTCADANAPCRLPNVFLADPPLKPVLARSVEAGLRLGGTTGARASFALFRSELADDIQFVSSGGAAVNAGYFQNIGKTRRQGAELGLDGRLGAAELGLRLSLVDARYRSGFPLHSPNNSSADGAGDIRVAAGDRLPGIPARSLKLFLDWPLAASRLGVDLAAYGRQYARGDENNRDAAGPLPGYAVVNLNLERRLARDWRVSATLSNVFDRRFASFGVLGRNFFTGPGAAFDAASARAEQFRTPGAPRLLWVALHYSWEKERQP